MSDEKTWPIKSYRIRFNPTTRQGRIQLQLDTDNEADVDKAGLSAEDIVALTALITRGGAYYSSDGSINIRG